MCWSWGKCTTRIFFLNSAKNTETPDIIICGCEASGICTRPIYPVVAMDTITGISEEIGGGVVGELLFTDDFDNYDDGEEDLIRLSSDGSRQGSYLAYREYYTQNILNLTCPDILRRRENDIHCSQVCG